MNRRDEACTGKPTLVRRLPDRTNPDDAIPRPRSATTPLQRTPGHERTHEVSRAEPVRARPTPPPAHDIRLRIWLAGTALDYVADPRAVEHIVDDWARRHWCTIEILDDTEVGSAGSPRLPCERLFLGP